MVKRFGWWLIFGLIISLTFGCMTVNREQVNNIEADNINNLDLESKMVKIPQDLDVPPRQDLRIAVISDLNSQYGSTEYEPEVAQAIALMPQWQPDLVLCGGDMIAGQKAALTKSQIESMWTAFDAQIAAPLRSQNIPFGFTIGNHDGSGAVKNQELIFQQERNQAQAYWQQQEHYLNFVDRANFPFYYSFQQNFQQKKIFFLVIDASSSQISPQQYEWIEQALNSDAAKQATARIVLGHLPLYPVAKTKNKPGEYLAEGAKLRSLLVENRVLMYVSGHHHVYYPGKVKNLKLFHAGALGQGARQLIDSELLPRKTMTLIDLDLTKLKLTYTTYDATTWQQISLKQLPTSIPQIDGKIWRHDQKLPQL